MLQDLIQPIGQANNHSRRVFRLAFMLVVFTLFASVTASCENNQPTIVITPTEITPTWSVVATATLGPTPTDQVYPTSTNTPILIPAIYDLPAWMGDPHTVILADLILESVGRDTISKITFFNAATGERFDMRVPSDAGNYFWFDNMHFGFLTNDHQQMYLIDTSTGQVSTSAILPEQTQLLNGPGYFNILKVNKASPEPDKFIFDYAERWRSRYYSRSGRFSLNQDENTPGNPITVIDIKTRQTIWQSSRFDGLWEVEFAWSPVIDSYLALVRGTPDEQNPYWLFTNNAVLEIIDVSTGEIIRSHKSDIGNFEWSPDGIQILYQNARSRYGNLGYAFTEAPCIFNIQTGEKKCVWNIPNRLAPKGYSLMTTTDYQWSPDGNFIYYDYEYGTSTQMIGNLCIYSLQDGHITCPTDNLTGQQDWPGAWDYGWSIQGYDFSPDGKYIHFCYSANSHLSDDQSGPSSDGLINIDGTGFVSWVGQVFEDYPLFKCSAFEPIWRPLP